jgi:hypothetical protein
MGDKTRVFRSPDEIPNSLRRRLMNSTRGMNSATILIADRGGREEIRKVLNGEPSPLRSRLRADFLRRSLDGPPASAPEPPAAPLKPGWTPRHWVELLLPCAVGILLWMIFNSR